jgi:hypothetical protein
MGLVRFGGGVVQISGSIAGNTHARNRFGNYVRPRTKPVNPNSDYQAAVRTSLSWLTEYWNSTMTAAQRTAWATFAASIAMKNRLGETIYLTGFNHFLRANIERKRLVLGIVANGPTVLSLPEKDPTFAVSGSEATQKLSVTFSAAYAWANEDGGHLVVYMGVPQLATRNFFNGPWRYTGDVDGAAEPPESPAEMDPAFTLTEGQKVWCYARVSRADARLSEPFYASFTVGA